MDIDSTTFYEEKDRLILKLKYFLNFELSASLLYFISFINSLAIALAAFLAVIFTPFMLYVLFKARRYGWISLFSVIILIPIFLSILLLNKSLYLHTFLLIELGIFYFYCFILRFVVNDWCEEINWKMFRKEQKKATDERNSIMQKYFS